MAEQLGRTVVCFTNEQWLNEASLNAPIHHPETSLTFPSSHTSMHTHRWLPKSTSHTQSYVRASCCCWDVGGVSTGLMSFWPMLSATPLNVWLPLLLLLLFVFPPCQHNPSIHPSWGPGPAGANPPLAASSGCSLLLLRFPSHYTHTYLSLGNTEELWFITSALQTQSLVLSQVHKFTITSSKLLKLQTIYF